MYTKTFENFQTKDTGKMQHISMYVRVHPIQYRLKIVGKRTRTTSLCSFMFSHALNIYIFPYIWSTWHINFHCQSNVGMYCNHVGWSLLVFATLDSGSKPFRYIMSSGTKTYIYGVWHGDLSGIFTGNILIDISSGNDCCIAIWNGRRKVDLVVSKKLLKIAQSK